MLISSFHSLLRFTDHEIDLVPISKIVSRASFGLLIHETAQEQVIVKELLGQGFIRLLQTLLHRLLGLE
jgi:hypothetical protein